MQQLHNEAETRLAETRQSCERQAYLNQQQMAQARRRKAHVAQQVQQLRFSEDPRRATLTARNNQRHELLCERAQQRAVFDRELNGARQSGINLRRRRIEELQDASAKTANAQQVADARGYLATLHAERRTAVERATERVPTSH